MQLAELYVLIGADLAQFEKGMADVDRRIQTFGANIPAFDLGVDTAALQADMAAAEKTVAASAVAMQQSFKAAEDQINGIEWLGPNREFEHTDATDALADEAGATRQLIAEKAKEAAARRANMTAAEKEADAKMRAAEFDRAAAKSGILGSKAVEAKETAKVADSLDRVDKAGRKTSATMNTVRASVTSMTASALQSAPGVAQLSSALGSMALGSAATIAIMGGVAAITTGWRIMTKEARDNAKATDEAVEALIRLARERANGVLGSLPGQTARVGIRQDDLRRAIEGEETVGTMTLAARAAMNQTTIATEFALSQKRIAAWKKQYEELGKIVAEGELSIRETTDRARQQAEAQSTRDLASLVSANKATATEIKEARRREAQLYREAADVAKGPQTDATRAERARLIADAKSLSDALKPKKSEISEFDRMLAQFREQELLFSRGERAAQEYALTLNTKLNPAQRQLLLAQFDASAAAKSQREADDKAKEAQKRNAEAIQATIKGLEDENVKLREGEEALLRYTLQAQGAAEADIDRATAAFRAGESMKKATKDAEEAAEELKRIQKAQQQEIESAAKGIAGAAGDAFTDWITGAEDMATSFTRMVDSMISDIIRLAAQKAIVDPLAEIFAGFIGAGIGAISGSVAPAGTQVTSGPLMSMTAGPMAGARAGNVVHVHQTIPISVQALDSRTAFDVISSNKAAVATAFLEAVRSSDALRKAIK